MKIIRLGKIVRQHRIVSLFNPSYSASRHLPLRRCRWGTINDYCRGYYRWSGDQAPLKLFSGQFLLANVASCVQAACVYVLPLFLVSRESMHSAPLPSTTQPPSVGQVGLSTALPSLLFTASYLAPSLKYRRHEQTNCIHLIRRESPHRGR